MVFFCDSVNSLNHNFQNDIHGDQPTLLFFIVCLSGLTSGKAIDLIVHETCLTLWILTTHICAENTFLASMNCFLFNLSPNVMIMCAWHQLMYIAIITPANRLHLPIFAAYNHSFGNKAHNANFRPNNNTKNYTHLTSIFNPNNLFKTNKSTFTANLKVRPWYLTDVFLTTLSAGYTSAILSDQSFKSHVASFTPEKNFGLF